MKKIEFQFLNAEGSLKEALQHLLGCSGQLLKKFFSSKELSRGIKEREVISLPLEFVNHLQINPEYNGPEVRILKETDDFIAIHKPGCIHSHPLTYKDTNTVLNFLQASNKIEGLKVNQQHYDRGLIFRLDFETSGLMIIAKTSDFFEKMRGHFETVMKKKLYLAVVEGTFDQEGEWVHFFQGSGVKGAKQKVTSQRAKDSHEGILKVKKIQEQSGKSLLLVELQTGLRHQIRSQLAFLGFPILGDELYGGNKAPRLFLHAWRYEWDQVVEDQNADLFDRFFDLHSAFQVSHDVLRALKS
jgi:23S rRNA pseudouridine1911/1915/1917 synthase